MQTNHSHIRTLTSTNLLKKTAGCGQCHAACQSACKTSCTVGNIPCEQGK
ncbi:MAG: six-cysteine peptide SCIFF [Firmicutes bacterium]|nr:six-cysteine peptide SCIFF [Bacillota bacterium]